MLPLYCQEEEAVEFNGVEVDGFYVWKFDNGSRILIRIVDAIVEENYTIYVFYLESPSFPDGVYGQANLSWEESIMLFFEASNITVVEPIMYLWWNTSYLLYALENESVMDTYEIMNIEERTVRYGLSPRKALLVSMGNMEVLVDVGTGVALKMEYGGQHIVLENTNMISPHAFLSGVLLAILLAILTIIVIKIGERGEKVEG